MYFHAEKRLLLTCDAGVSRYDAESCAFILMAPISKQEQRLLACLMNHENVLVTRKMLLSQVWGGRVVSDNSINVTVSRLRSKLRCISPVNGCLTAVRGSGFVFSVNQTGLVPVMSRRFLLSSLKWSEGNACSHDHE